MISAHVVTSYKHNSRASGIARDLIANNTILLDMLGVVMFGATI